MLKICGYTICKTLEMKSYQTFISGLFPSKCKKWQYRPFSHTKNLISLLPTSDKIFERLIYEMFRLFLENELTIPQQSGFKPCDSSCFSQMLSIIHNYKSFKDGLEVASVYIDISKAFDKVLQEGIISIRSQNGIINDC